MQKSNSTAEWIPRWTLGGMSLLTVVVLVGIFLFLCLNARGIIGHIGFREFFFHTSWNPMSYNYPSWGIVTLVTSTAIISALSLLFAVPMGLAIAITLSELASTRTRSVVKPLIEMIASIPSVVLGVVGLVFVAPLIARLTHHSSGLNALTASILIAVATLPTIASICEDALSSVPKQFREASLALGASQWTTIVRIVLPAAGSGIMAALMLGLGRVIGETMIVLMVAGNSRAFPHSILDPLQPITATIAIEIKEVVVGSLHWQALFAIGLVLFAITFVLNAVADYFLAHSTTNE